MYTHRFYRAWVSQRKLFRFRVLLHESDIEIAAESDGIVPVPVWYYLNT